MSIEAVPNVAAPKPATRAKPAGSKPTRARRAEPASGAEPLPFEPRPRKVTDTLVFRVSPVALSLVGGSGRGAGWMGIVDLPREGEPLAAHVLGMGKPAHVEAPGDPIRIVGPYWASHAFLVPVGGEHLVVFGGQQPLAEPDATLVPLAARLVADLEQVPPEKLLADELEVVQAIRDLIDNPGGTVEEVARHVAARAADPLSCEVGAVLVRSNGRLVAEVVTRDWPTRLDRDQIRATLVRLFARVEHGAFVEQELEAVADDALGRNQGLVARFAVPIADREPFGVLVVAHAATRPRGFTNLCQRIGNALAGAAAPVLRQAEAREALELERDRYAREARTDRLTGLDNRAAWDDHIANEDARRARYDEKVTIVSADLDALKEINDRDGHAAGDQALKAAAELLRRSARASDRVARVGGDEFLVLMPRTDEVGAERFMSRVRAGIAVVLRGTGCDSISLGAATSREDETLAATVARADAAMYASKPRARKGPEKVRATRPR
ncbi:MAG TPA: diguanylate cyclase [Patescibacteria group bacterium]|nr:diguanylate cyclase [Patescibacteria group bacterium]